MNEETLRILNFNEIEYYNDIHNCTYRLNEYANGVSGVFGELLYNISKFDGELDEKSIADVNFITNSIAFRLNNLFAAIDLLANDIKTWTESARNLELTAKEGTDTDADTDDDPAADRGADDVTPDPPSDVEPEEWGDGE